MFFSRIFNGHFCHLGQQVFSCSAFGRFQKHALRLLHMRTHQLWCFLCHYHVSTYNMLLLLHEAFPISLVPSTPYLQTLISTSRITSYTLMLIKKLLLSQIRFPSQLPGSHPYPFGPKPCIYHSLPQHIKKCIETEVSEGAMLGPFNQPPFSP